MLLSKGRVFRYWSVYAWSVRLQSKVYVGVVAAEDEPHAKMRALVLGLVTSTVCWVSPVTEGDDYERAKSSHDRSYRSPGGVAEMLRG